MTASSGIRIDGAAAFDEFGGCVSGNVDINGDGISDVLIGAEYATADGMAKAGKACVLFGGSSLPFSIDSADSSYFNGIKGFILPGENSLDRFVPPPKKTFNIST